ncbi:MAG: hypothetical protein FGM28_02465 [Limnohabitans sp.]|nr:hypothetical protein [Limnohabitans sp.]
MKHFDPAKPNVPLDQLSDAQRRIAGGPVWKLDEVQRLMAAGELKSLLTPKSGSDVYIHFSWTLREVGVLFHQLQKNHFRNSQWVSLPKNPNDVYAADSYVLPKGYLPHGSVLGNDLPSVYVKFTIRSNPQLMTFVSVHPST